MSDAPKPADNQEAGDINNPIDSSNLDLDPPPYCTPGERRCIQGTVHICDPRGMRWIATGERC